MHISDWVFLISLHVEIPDPESMFLSYSRAMADMMSQSSFPLTVRSDHLDSGRRFRYFLLANVLQEIRY